MRILADLRYGGRTLMKSPALTLAAIGAMALGIGVNSMMFTIYNAALFKSLPFERPEEVVHIHTRNLREGWDERGSFYEDFLEYRDRATRFKGLAAFMGSGYRLADERGTVQEIDGCLVTAGLFSLLGQRPLIGRDFLPADAGPGATPVVILSFGLWQSAFGGDPSILGKQVRLSSEARTIVGVMPAGMSFPRKARVWVPIVDTPQNRDSWYLRYGFYLVGRLKEAGSLAAAEGELRGIARQIGASRPREIEGIEPVLLPWVEWDIRPKDRLMALTAMGAVTFVLLIACTNVANLLLSRAELRRREVAIRIALGATRLRITGQLLVESVLLSVLGGAAGLGLALALVRLFVLAIAPLGAPYWVDWSMDAASLAYLVVVSVGSGILFGLAPALQMSGVKVSEAMQETGRSSSDGARGRALASGLVVAEISLTLALMTGAGLMIRSFLAMQQVDVGVDRRNLLVVLTPMGETQYPEAAHRTAFADRLSATLRSHPDILAVTVASDIPAGGASVARLTLEGRETAAGSGPFPVAMIGVGEGYFGVLGLRMLRGREFIEADSVGGAPVAIINEPFATRHFHGADPVGQRIRLNQGPWRTVVGVSPPIRQVGLRGALEPLAYVPLREGPPYSLHLLVRARSANPSVAQAIRREVGRLDPDLPVPTITSFDEYIDKLSMETRILGMLFSLFAAIGLFLSTLGIYAVTAYSTSRRTREIGVRIALGATGADIAKLVLRSGAKHLGLALPIGLGGALALSRIFESVLFEVTPLDPVTFVAMPVGLSIITVAACLIPARRASRLRPVDALRTE